MSVSIISPKGLLLLGLALVVLLAVVMGATMVIGANSAVAQDTAGVFQALRPDSPLPFAIACDNSGSSGGCGGG